MEFDLDYFALFFLFPLVLSELLELEYFYDFLFPILFCFYFIPKIDKYFDRLKMDGFFEQLRVHKIVDEVFRFDGPG